MKICEVIEMIERDGWYTVMTKGSHRQYQHPDKGGRVTIAGHPAHELAPGTLNGILKQAQSDGEGGTVIMHRFLVVIEKANGNFSAYSPDLPGCVATGKTHDEAEQNMYEAIEMHMKGLLEDKESIPESHAAAKYMVVA